MKAWICSECETEFLQESATSCPQCGGIQISGGGEIVDPGANGEAENEEKSLERVREVLHKFYREIYELSFAGAEAAQALDKALEELRPYLRV